MVHSAATHSADAGNDAAQYDIGIRFGGKAGLAVPLLPGVPGLLVLKDDIK